MRNPFRITQRPGTDELWVGDVGWNTWEEIDRLTAPTGTAARNFGWPCYEGVGAQGGYQGAGLNLCSSLYGTPGSVASPYYPYNHANCVVVYPNCHTGGSSITGIAFYQGGSYPVGYTGALFFADHTSNEIWAMMPGGNGLPDPANIQSFVGVDSTGGAAGHPVDLKIGPGGDLFYVDMEGGSLHRIIYTAANQPPTARISANPTTGNAPLTVAFDGTGSTDPEARPLSYSWDLNGDGTFGDATTATTGYTYTASGTYNAQLRVTDDQGASNTAAVTITVGNTAPVAVIDSPTSALTWQVGQTINFSGHATDTQDGTPPASALSWSVTLNRCFTPTNCHTHQLQTFSGVSSGSFPAPDHEYPCWLELRLTATDSGGLTSTASVRLDPRTVTLTLKTTPGALQLVLNGTTHATPFTGTVVLGSSNSLSAPTPQAAKNSTYTWVSWSDGGAATHNVTALTSTTYTAAYRKR